MIEEKKIKSIQFSILSPTEIKKYSVAKIVNDATFENNLPKKGGLMDTRLGVVEKDFFCSTDMCSYIECPGYFGHIELQKPVFHEGFMEFILLIIRCVDHTTSKLIVNQNSQKVKNVLKIRNPRQRLTAMAKLCTSVCSINNLKRTNELDTLEEGITIQPKYSRDGWCIVAKFDPKITSEPTRILSAERIYEIFKNISDNDCKKIGLNPKLARPDWMILTVLPIPPPTIRPSVVFDLTSRAEDDLTYKLGDIIRSNKSLLHLIISCAPVQSINEQINLLQYHIGSYMNNNVPNLAKSMQRTGRAIKSIRQRIQGKEGRVRGNLMGKRVDFSARTVITPDPNISLDEIGVPWTIALNLTYPEIVTKFNIIELKKIVNNGPFCHPGAKYIIKNDGSRIDLRYVKKLSDIKLEFGYQVERHLQDGDIVLFNRQPSLHKMSMMGHIVKIMFYSTFRMNLSATSPYNADFDGDEMNLHLPQTLEARAELLNLLMVSKCIISQQGNKPVMGIVQDSLIGSLLLTQRDTFLNKYKLDTILIQIENWNGNIPIPTIIKPEILWTGKQLISIILPKINLIRNSIAHPDNEKSNISPGDTRVFILDGQLISGIIDKRTVGSSGGSLIHICWKEYGAERTTQLISQFQLVVNSWLLIHGFSVGIGDTFADKKTMLDVVSIIKNAKTEVQKIVKKKTSDSLEIFPDKDSHEIFECQVNKILNNARDKAGSNAQKSLLFSNNIKRMVISGSKGSFINISQIVACVGQQNVEGKRIPLAFGGRALPHFSLENNGPETRGFIQNSYFSGLKPDEFFFHAMGGREGLIDTAIKTSETGYIQRRLSKVMEDVNVEYDLTVRNAQNSIIQFFYGEDTMDAAFLESQNLSFVNMADRELELVYKMNINSPCYGLNTRGETFLTTNKKYNNNKIQEEFNAEFSQLNRDRYILREALVNGAELNVPLPVNIQRLITNAKILFKNSLNRPEIFPLDVISSIKMVEKFCFDAINSNKTIKCKKFCTCCKCISVLNATLLFRMYLRATLATKLVIFKYKMTKESFSWVLNEICLHFRKGIVNPGEMVGIVSAQSIGQPATQMTLNTFHYAGVSAKNVTLGVPRLKEIINVLKLVKTPSLTIYLRKEYGLSYERVKRLQRGLEFISLKNILQESSFFYDPDPFQTICINDRHILENYFEIPDETLEYIYMGVWVMKTILHKDKFIDKKLSIDQLVEKIKKKIKPLSLLILNSDENGDLILIRFKIFWPSLNWNKKDSFYKKKSLSKLLIFERHYLKRMNHFIINLNLKDYGTFKIKKIYSRKIETTAINMANGLINFSNEFVLDTEGVDLRYILNYNGIDYTRSLSNDILEIFKILGIEAVRKVLIQELRNLISFDGSYVNFRHLSLLVDVMTYRGKLMSITRHGINKTEIGPIAKCSFEETVDIFFQSAVFGVCDDLKGVSANTMVGNLAFIGTGKIDLFLNELKLKNSLK
nr:DNA-directed RNA polymerase II largest chain [Cryptomonas curvata]